MKVSGRDVGHEMLETKRSKKEGDINTCAGMNMCAYLSAHIGLRWEPKKRKKRGAERCKCREHFQVSLLKRTATANVSCTNTAAVMHENSSL